MATGLFNKDLPHSDVVLVFPGEVRVHAHKFVLSRSFGFFLNMFEVGDCSVFEMQHCPEEVTAERVCMLLSHLYEECLMPGVLHVRKMCRGHWWALDLVRTDPNQSKATAALSRSSVGWSKAACRAGVKNVELCHIGTKHN